MRNINNIIFDLDGTLIDSEEGILFSLDYALKKNNIQPSKKLSSKLIGPPLKELLKLVTNGYLSEKSLGSLARDFKAHYDNIGYTKTLLFENTREQLLNLRKNRFKLYIVTNKRSAPTQSILDLTNINDYFSKVYCIDTFEEINNKATLLGRLLSDECLDNLETLYIGDTTEDELCSEANKLHFLPASWNPKALRGGPDKIRTLITHMSSIN